MKIPLPKLKAILLYFGNYTDRRYLGKTKLLKLIYFLDFIHIKKYGSPITYDSYFNLEYGPIPSVIKNLVDEVDKGEGKSAALSDTIRIETHTKQKIHQVIPLRKFTDEDKKYFSETELEVLNEVCERFGKQNTDSVEKASHIESAWSKTSFRDEIPYTLAAEDKDCAVSREEIELLLKLL